MAVALATDQSGLVGEFWPGTQYPFPDPNGDLASFFDRPSWERPTLDNPEIGGSYGDKYTTVGTPGFDGGGNDPAVGEVPGFSGGGPSGIAGGWSPPNQPPVPGDGGSVSVGTGPAFSIEAARRDFYPIEIRDTSGDLLSLIPKQIGGSLTRRLNKASELSFRIPLSSEGATELVRPNIVWLRDRWGFVIDTFQVHKKKLIGTGDASYIDVECQSMVAQLGEEYVSMYESIETTVSAHVASLLAEQERASAISFGEIDPQIGDTVLFFATEETSILAALLKLQEIMPRANRGYIYVDPQSRLQWRMSIGDQTEQVITRGTNAYDINSEIDYTRTVNRVWAYGEGQSPADKLSLIHAGEAVEYIEDAASIAANGLQELRIQDRRIKDSSTLLLVANRILEERVAPPVVVSVGLLDVAKSDNAPAGFSDINIGGNYRVVDTVLGVDTSIEIVSIKTDLSRPVPIQVELTNQARSIANILESVFTDLHQPLDVLSDWYPNITRNLTDGAVPKTLKAGDVRWNEGEDRAEMYDGEEWRAMGATGWVKAATKAELPDPSTLDETTLGRVTGGDDQGMVCIINPAKDGWDAWNFFE